MTGYSFFDQNVSNSSFPCFSDKHGHPDVPGRWMTEGFADLLAKMNKLKETAEEKDSKREIVYSVEGTCNEYFLSEMDICESRVNVYGVLVNNRYEEHQIPLHQYLFHDYIIYNGGFGYSPEPYHNEIKNAINLVYGNIPGAVLMNDGNLQNQENTDNWAVWGEQPGNQEFACEMINTASAARRGAGKDFLIYGKMQRPADIDGIEVLEWRSGKNYHTVPSVFHSAWTAPDGSFAIAAANWTGETREISVNDSRIAKGAEVYHINGEKVEKIRI